MILNDSSQETVKAASYTGLMADDTNRAAQSGPEAAVEPVLFTSSRLLYLPAAATLFTLLSVLQREASP